MLRKTVIILAAATVLSAGAAADALARGGGGRGHGGGFGAGHFGGGFGARLGGTSGPARVVPDPAMPHAAAPRFPGALAGRHAHFGRRFPHTESFIPNDDLWGYGCDYNGYYNNYSSNYFDYRDYEACQ